MKKTTEYLKYLSLIDVTDKDDFESLKNELLHIKVEAKELLEQPPIATMENYKELFPSSEEHCEEIKSQPELKPQNENNWKHDRFLTGLLNCFSNINISGRHTMGERELALRAIDDYVKKFIVTQTPISDQEIIDFAIKLKEEGNILHVNSAVVAIKLFLKNPQIAKTKQAGTTNESEIKNKIIKILLDNSDIEVNSVADKIFKLFVTETKNK